MYVIYGKNKSMENVKIDKANSKKDAQDKKKKYKDSKDYYNIYIVKEKG